MMNEAIIIIEGKFYCILVIVCLKLYKQHALIVLRWIVFNCSHLNFDFCDKIESPANEISFK